MPLPNRNFSVDYRNLKGILPGSPYPVSELCMARDEFARLWRLALNRNPTARLVASYHHNYPPNIRLRNVIEYPFLHENARLRDMPELPASIRGPLKRTHEQGRSNQAQPESQPTESCTKKICLSRGGDEGQVDTSGTPIYICDHCRFEADQRSSLLVHLEEHCHATGSEYKLLDTDSSDDDIDGISERKPVMTNPRAVSVPLKAMSDGSAGDMVVLCPVCHLIFPDKIACAYHHRIQHTNHLDKYTFGTILAVRTLSLFNQPVCCNCRQAFRDQRDLVAHWSDVSQHCVFPFLPIFSREEAGYAKGNSIYPLVVNVKCGTCSICLDRTLPLPPSPRDYGYDTFQLPVNSGNAKRSYPNFVREKTSGFGRFCVNHAYLHVRNVRYATCHLKIRFVHVHKTPPESLPTYHIRSDSVLMAFSLRECKQLLSYLKTYYKSKRPFIKSADDQLRALLNQNRLHQQQTQN